MKEGDAKTSFLGLLFFQLRTSCRQRADRRYMICHRAVSDCPMAPAISDDPAKLTAGLSNIVQKTAIQSVSQLDLLGLGQGKDETYVWLGSKCWQNWARVRPMRQAICLTAR